MRSASKYWQTFLKDFSSSTKLWLEGVDTPLRLTDENKPQFIIEKISIHSELEKSLQKFIKKNKISISTLLHGAWGLLLNRFATSEDMIFGTACLSKQKLQSKKVTVLDPILPVRSIANKKDTILNYLKKIHKQLSQHEKYEFGFETLELKEQFHDIFEYLIIFSSPHTRKKNNKDRVINIDKFPLLLYVQQEKPLKLELCYNKLKYTRESIKNIIDHFIIILEKIAFNSDEIVTYFSILSSEEKQKVLTQWNISKFELPPTYKTSCVHHLFSDYAEKNPQHLAVHSSTHTLTYQELDKLSHQLAQYLCEKHIKPGDKIAVLMERTPALISIMLAVFKVGAIYVPINPKYPEDRIEFILSDCNPSLILVNNLTHIPKKFRSICIAIDDEYKILQDFSSQEPLPTVSPQSVAYIIYTSGTTGQPKGVMIKHESLVSHAYWYREFFKVTPDDRASQFASQGFDTFFCETTPYLSNGASIHIIDDNAKLTPSLFLPWLVQQKITICDLPTAYGLILFSIPLPDNLSLRILKVGGESITRYPSEVFPFDIWNGYGPTETTVEITFMKIYQANTPLENQPCKHTPPPIGKPIANSEIYVVDKNFQPVPIGIAGELLIGGLCLSSGYLNRSQLTREKFVRNIFSKSPHSKLYKTGDLVRWLPDGNLEYIGRLDHQVKIRGFRVELSEIETSLTQCPDVSEVVILAKEIISGQKTLVAYLVPNLDKTRIPFQERCLLSINDINFYELITEDLSKEGTAITGIPIELQLGQPIKLNLKLPGMSEGKWLTGKIIWQIDQRAGIQFDNTPQQKTMLEKSVEYYLSTHNLMETLRSAAAKRNLQKALKKKLPDYMIPSVFTILPQFPLTFNGKIDWKALPPPKDFERLLERNYVAPRNETEKALAVIWMDLLNQKQISITDSFFDLGGNSLLVSQLSVRILQHFDISVPAKIFFDLPFIPILAEYIDSKGKQFTNNSSIQEEINQDSILHEDITPSQNLDIATLKQPQGILLTGAGGFLGIYLLRELLTKTNAIIYCLIRKGEFESAAKRLIANLKHFQLDQEISLANRRIIIIDSDIGLDNFGISTEQYNHLAGKVDMIFHCGAQVNTMAGYTTLRNSNVQGTLEVIKFATFKKDKPIHYISTLSAAYKLDEKGDYIEDFPEANAGDLVGGYAISKWVSERLLTQIYSRGLPICIYRSGYILGQSDTGVTNLNDALLLLIKGCIQLGSAPDWNEKITLLPVDFVSKAIIEIALYQAEKGDVFHIDHPQGMMWRDLISWLNNYGYLIKICSHTEWLHHLSHISRENALFPFLPHYLSIKENPNTPGTNMSHAWKILSELDIDYPEIDDAMLNRYMNYLCKVGFLPTPQNRKTSLLDSTIGI